MGSQTRFYSFIIFVNLVVHVAYSSVGPDTFLEWLLYPYSTDVFITDHQHSDALHVARSFRNYYDVLHLNDTLRQLPEELLELHSDHNRVLSIYQAETHSSILKNLARSFTDLVPGCNVKTHLFQIPSQAKGIEIRYEAADLFILQVRGQKRWRIYQPIHTDCVSGHKPEFQTLVSNDDPHVMHSIMSNSLQVILNEGDLLYIPHSHLYDTLLDPHADNGNESVHISVEVHSELFVDYLSRVLTVSSFISASRSKTTIFERLFK